MKRKMSIGTCIKLTFGVVLLLMVVITLINVNLMNRATNLGNQLYDEYGKTQGEAGLGLAYFQEVKCNIRNVLYVYENNPTKQQESIEAIKQSESDLYASLEAAENGLSEGVANEELDKAYTSIENYVKVVDECVESVQAGDLGAAVTHFVADGMTTADAAEVDIRTLINRLDEDASSAQEEFTNTQKWADLLIVVLLVLSFIIGLFTIFFLLKQIRRPVVSLAQAAGKVALGEINVDIPEKCDLAEIEDLAKAFHQMVENLKKQTQVINSISQGDLSAEIKAHSANDAVGNALNKLLQDNNYAFKAIRNATNQISLGSSQIAAASQTLAQGSTQQASAIEQIVASVSDIADKTKNNASQADEVNRIVMEAKEDVTTGNSRMSEMVAAMNEINEASENIQKIIKVIDDIAFNTNILALNATVEAARAGEQGKGFAVVAEEVRNLAGRSAEASSQTAEMIEDSIRKVKRGGELAKETADALQVISEMIERITNLSQDIAKASNDQATATAQIDQALMQVSQVVQTNSATSQQCASASEELSGQARGLNQELSRFRLKDVIGNMPSQTLEYSEPDVHLLEGGMKY